MNDAVTTDPKDAFKKAKEIVNQQQNSALYHLIDGLLRLSDQITNMDYRLRQIENDLKELRER